VRNLTKAAQEQYLASEEGRRATRVTLIGEIAAAWLTLASDRDQLATSERTLKTYAQTLDLTKAQFRIGTASALEMQQAETSYQSARNDIAVLQTEVAQDLNALQLLTGAPVPEALQPQGWGRRRPRWTPCLATCRPTSCCAGRTCSRPNTSSSPRTPTSGQRARRSSRPSRSRPRSARSVRR
jgi:outer membrane protein TolC